MNVAPLVPSPGLVVLVAGDRDFKDRGFVREKLQAFHKAHAFARMLLSAHPREGTCLFADAWARDRGVPTKLYLPRWHVDGLQAAVRRNARLLDTGRPAIAFFFPSTSRDVLGLLTQAREAHERGTLLVVECSP